MSTAAGPSRGLPDIRALLAHPAVVDNGRRFGIWFALLALMVVGGSLSPAFLTPTYLLTIVAQASIVGVAAIGVTMVMITGRIDVSVAGVITLTGFIAVGIMHGNDKNIVPAVAAVVAVGLAVGLINGYLIAFWGVESFIVTLAMGATLIGVAELYTGGFTFGDPAPAFVNFFAWRPGGIPTLALLFATVAGIGLLLVRRTTFGQRLFLIGGNYRSAYLSGVPIRRTIVLAYAAAGVCAAIGSLALIGFAGVPSGFTGLGLEFQVLAAVVLGGTTFEGGRGGIAGTVAGVLTLAVASTLVIILGFPFAAQQVVTGAIIVAVGCAYAASLRKEE
ncbi:MAG TPA: ABC transporter permease [Candidatus Dormibacteraeota bacterium]|jgi:ribose transport system permease protein